MERLRVFFVKTGEHLRLYHLHVLSAALILSVILVVYWRDFEILANEALNSEAASHIILVPILLSFLLYKKRDSVRASMAAQSFRRRPAFKYLYEVIGVALCLTALLLYWYGSYTFYPLEYHVASLPIFVAGTILILFNMKILRVLAFPILFSLFLIPPPAEILYTVGGALANFNTDASYTLLKTLGLPVTLQTTYGPPTLAVASSTGEPIYFAIDLPCSGIYSFIAFLMLATFLAYIVTAPAYKKSSLFIFGFAVFGVLNIFRISAIVSIGYWLGEEIAMLIFHNVTGWILILAGILLILFAAEKLLKIQITQPSQEQPPCWTCNASLENYDSFCTNCGRFLKTAHSRISSKFWSKLILLLLGTYVVTLSIQAPTFAVAQGPMGVTSNSSWDNATNVFPQVQDYELMFLYRDTDYEKIANQDASLLYAYLPANMSDPTIYVDIGIADTISNLHNWEVCLITWKIYQGREPLVKVLDSRDTQLLQDAPIIARYLVFESPANYTQVTLYWYEQATFNVGVTVEHKYVRISLIILTYNSSMYSQFENQLFVFGQSIASYWEPLKSQSIVSIGVPMQQLLLGLMVAFVTVTKTVEYTSEWRKRNYNLRIFDSFASLDEKLVLQIIQQLAKGTKGVQTSFIASTLESKVEKPVKHDDLTRILNRLEEYGLVRRDITDIDGKPFLVWKS